MPRTRRLIIGLGNPGEAYAGTRHNVGFMVADAVAEKTGLRLEPARGNVLLGWGSWRGCPFGVAKPMTYMNLSGQAVQALVRRFGLDPGDLLVVYDDLNLPPGKLRLRPGGSAGGHNGVQDIIDRLGTDAFPRLRLGIGHDFPRGGQVDYVLAPFDPEQQRLIEEVLPVACDAALTFVTDGLTTAMNRFNRR
ncbi:aminoacyl-tRNA hydrolase [Rhodocaloribacter litoris]|uniref:aminoacyl-tRNA hydrolase n=1 Tax=Rhodocaloribacter litoris TaxID=2558931 RepID=UPI00141E7EC8|nr:aminoacyl-tRNA hydrolase [Rhodocaloribacter litoris]QXD14249.1 aminoacyl-tRNA hydrolase [Rhodocaloribacter litoris]GIV59874.1 MAG: peptidyl-tRNA hydrolase [Rhodothermaceae bacterium]